MRSLNFDKESYLYLTFLITIRCIQLYHNTLSCRSETETPWRNVVCQDKPDLSVGAVMQAEDLKSRSERSCKLRSEVTKSRSAGSTDINQFLS